MMKSTTGVIRLLGTGASLGVPRLGCHCEVCLSTNLHWHRKRTSALVSIGNKQLLIDAGPDFRQQALLYHIDRVDALLVTHVHYDHVGGIDDLRALFYKHKTTIPIYGSQESLQEIELRNHYLFVPKLGKIRELSLSPFSQDEGVFQIDKILITYFSYFQQKMKVTGYRIGKMAYVTDIKQYDSSLFEHLKDLDLLILSALSFHGSDMHLAIDEAIALAQTANAKKTILVHLSHEVDPNQFASSLPERIELGYDGEIYSFKV